MKIYHRLLFLFFILIGGSIFAQTDFSKILWYQETAKNWNEALPIGNGHLGAMIYGNPTNEHVQLNENTLYSGDPNHTFKNFEISEKLLEVEELIKKGKFKESQTIITKNWLGRNHQLYQPMSDLWINMNHNQREIKNFKRNLDLSFAVSTVDYQAGNTNYT